MWGRGGGGFDVSWSSSQDCGQAAGVSPFLGTYLTCFEFSQQLVKRNGFYICFGQENALAPLATRGTSCHTASVGVCPFSTMAFCALFKVTLKNGGVLFPHTHLFLLPVAGMTFPQPLSTIRTAL